MAVLVRMRAEDAGDAVVGNGAVAVEKGIGLPGSRPTMRRMRRMRSRIDSSRR